MAINFPTSLDVFTDPTASDQLNLPSHSGQHTDLNNAVEALEAKVGINSSAVTSSHDYKIAQLEAASNGKILQIVRATDTVDRTTSTATFADANISVTITPTAATSTLLIVWTNHLISNLSTQLSAHLQITDSSNVALSGAEDARIGNGGGSVSSFLYNTLIGYAAPATTSAVTYKGRWKLNTASFSATLANATTTGQMFALEVGA